MKEHEFDKKESWKKLNAIYIVAYTLFLCNSETVTWVGYVLFTSGKAVQLSWYEFSTYLHHLQPHSLV